MSAYTRGRESAAGPLQEPGDAAVVGLRPNRRGIPMRDEPDDDNPAQRRTARKRARLAVPPPERNNAYDHMTIDDLRRLRRTLSEDEGRVSYWRRIVQAKIDLIRDGSPRPGTTIEGLNRVLGEHLGMPRRIAYLPVQPVEGEAPLPELPWLWQHLANPDMADNDALLSALGLAETELSAHRRELHDQIDLVTGQLIARYREDPSMALTALPTRSTGLHRL